MSSITETSTRSIAWIATALTLWLAGCAATDPAPPAPLYGDPLKHLSWMVGTWNGSMPNGMRMQEHWIPGDGGLMLGVNRTARGPEFVAFEFLRIEARDEDAIVYVAQPGGVSPGVEFTLVESVGTRAVFSNPEHDFPQRLTYTRVGESLTVEVEGEVNGEAGGFALEWTLAGE